MLRLILLAVVLALAAAEVLAPRVVERSVASRLQEAAGLAAAPEVEVRGRPFLTQAVRGRYDDVVVRATDVPAGPLGFDSVAARLSGAEVPLGDVLSGSVAAVPVAELSTRAVVGYDDLTALLRERGLRVSPAGQGLVRVTGSATVLGRTLEASAVSRPTLEGRTLVVTAEHFEVGNARADALLSRALGNRLDFRVELEPLPYGLELRGLQAEAGGVVLLASATDAVLR